MEVEIRAKIKNVSELETNLNSLSEIEEKVSDKREVDVYLKSKQDTDRNLILRVRKNYQENSGLLTFKAKNSIHDTEGAWQDFDTEITDPDKLERLLVKNGYVYVCLIDKVRQSFIYKDLEINVDNVRDLGVFIEIEKNVETEEEIENARDEIKNILFKLGIKEEDITNKGYVPLILGE